MFLFLVTGPSGVGKGSLLRPLLAADPRLRFSVSCTTREPRPGEVDGADYHFVARAEFEQMRDAGEFAEWAVVHDQLYGTRNSDLEAALDAGQIPVLDIDVQGGLAVLDRFQDRVVSVFVFPPSWEELERRLRGRGTNDAADIETRLATARTEVEQADAYRYWLVNDDLEAARGRLQSILEAATQRREHVDPPV